MLQPARRKFRKEQKGRNTGVATRGGKVWFGGVGLKAPERGRRTARPIEGARRAVSRPIKRGGGRVHLVADGSRHRRPGERDLVCPRESLQILGRVEPRGVAAEGDPAPLADPVLPVPPRRLVVGVGHQRTPAEKTSWRIIGSSLSCNAPLET